MKINAVLLSILIVLCLILSMNLFFIEKSLKTNRDISLLLLNTNQQLLETNRQLCAGLNVTKPPVNPDTAKK